MLQCVEQRLQIAVAVLSRIRRAMHHKFGGFVGCGISRRVKRDIAFCIGPCIDRVFGLHAKLRSVFGLAEVDQIHADRNGHHVDHDGNNGYDEIRADGVAVNRIKHSESKETNRRRSCDQSTDGRLLNAAVEQQPAQIIAHHKHDDDADETDGGQCCVFRKHCTGRFDDGHK